jgi:hypothetical protein
MSEKPRFTSFRNQRVGWTFTIFTIVFCFTTSVLWGHVDRIITNTTYQMMFKGGLLLLPAVTLLMTIWELFVDDVSAKRIHESHQTVKRLVNWCFYASICLALCEIVHAGGVLTFESSTVQQKETIAAIGDAQAKVAAASTSAAIETSGKVAQEMNANGQRVTARRTIASGGEVARSASESAQRKVAEAAERSKASTFLPDWYIHGGMYVALPLLALICFGITMIFARKAQPHIDKNDDGKPDYEKPKEAEWNHLTPPQPVPASGKTTTIAGSTNFYDPTRSESK